MIVQSFVLILMACLVQKLVIAQAQASCFSPVFAGFDSRLHVDVFALLPDRGNLAVGFEIIGDQAIVAFPHELIITGGSHSAALPSLEMIDGLSVDAQRTVVVSTRKGFKRLGPHGLEDEPAHSAGKGKLFNSGTPAFLYVLQQPATEQLFLVRSNKQALPLVEITGKLSIASWNAIGLGAIVNSEFYIWPTRAQTFRKLSSDPALVHVKDLCLIGEHKAVVAMNKIVILVTPDTRLPVVAMDARCRWQDNSLYLLDQSRHVIWRVNGLDTLGRRVKDDQYARQLIRSLPPSSSECDSRFREACRLVGPKQARALLESK
jgi:hypothetical protein